MTKKHMIRLAGILREVKSLSPSVDQITHLQNEIERWLKEENPRFDMERFRAACTPKETTNDN